MTETYKETLEERKSKRRQYLRTETTGFVWAFFCFCACALFGCLAFGGLVVLLFSGVTVESLYTLFWAILFGGISVQCFRLFDSTIEKLKAQPRIPPVEEQIAALPAEEILVRGSEQPTALPEELLRAAHASRVDPGDELLRADEGYTNESVKP